MRFYYSLEILTAPECVRGHNPLLGLGMKSCPFESVSNSYVPPWINYKTAAIVFFLGEGIEFIRCLALDHQVNISGGLGDNSSLLIISPVVPNGGLAKLCMARLTIENQESYHGQLYLQVLSC